MSTWQKEGIYIKIYFHQSMGGGVIDEAHTVILLHSQEMKMTSHLRHVFLRSDNLIVADSSQAF